VTAVTVWAAIGDIQRFADPQHLVGYPGLGARVHNSGLSTRTGRITKAGRRDLRVVLIEAAQVAANNHPHWQAELARLEPRLGRNKAIVAIARKLLVAVWYILAQHKTDRFAEPEQIAQKLLKFAYQLGKENRPGQSAAQFVRQRLEALQLGSELTTIAWGSKKPIPLPPSKKQSEQRPKWRQGAMNSTWTQETHEGVLRARRSISLYNACQRFAHSREDVLFLLLST